MTKHPCLTLLIATTLCSLNAYAAPLKSTIDSAAKWLWYPEPFSTATNNTSRYGRTVFDIQGDVRRATLYMNNDDNGRAWLNGQPVSSRLPAKNVSAYDATGLLQKGRNALCVQVNNGGGPGGMIVHLEIEKNDGVFQDVVSNGTWKISREAPANWNMVDFDDASWVNAKELGNTLASPWANLYDFRFIYTPAERALFDAEQAAVRSQYEHLLQRLKSEPELHASLDIRRNAPPSIVINGRPCHALLYDSPYPWPYDDEKTIEKIAKFHEAGINLYVLGVDVYNCWKSDNSIDFDMIEMRLRRALLLNPDAYLMLAINTTSAPSWWLESHPDEMIDYGNGGIDPAAKDPIKRVRQPSMGSDIWRHDFSNCVKRIVEYVESQPFGKRVFAYRIDNGVYREWHYFGMADGLPDSGRRMGEKFTAYLRKKYKTDKALQDAWKRPGATLATAKIPEKDERLASIQNGLVMRDPVESAAVLDFLHCQQECVRDFIIACNTAAKDACGWRKLCGNYSGYFFGMSYPAEGWHLENRNVLASRAVDFQISPNLYAHRKIDEAEFGRSLVESYTLCGKLNIQEHDTRTTLSVDDPGHTHVKTLDESVAALSRDFAQSLIRNSGCWYLDFSKPWYNDAKIFNMFKQFMPILDLAKNNQPASEVAFVGDLESVYYHRVAHLGKCLTIDCNIEALTHSGTPFDTIAFNDLSNPQVRDYKVYIFANLFYVTPEKLAVVEKLRQAGKTLVWMYAPGYLTPVGHGVDALQKCCGFKVRETTDTVMGDSYLLDGSHMNPPTSYKLRPSFVIDDDQAVVLGYKDGDSRQRPVFARRSLGNSEQYYAATGYLSTVAWQDIFAKAGVHCYEKSGKCVVWASQSFISINGRPGRYNIKLPTARKVTQLLPQPANVSIKTRSISVELTEEAEMRLFHLED